MRMALVLLAGTLSFGMPPQGLAQGPASSPLWQKPAPTSAAAIAVLRAPDHRWEGMAIGAGVGAIAFGLLGAAICAQSESSGDCTGMVLGVGLLGAFCGGITGGLIGGAIPKGEGADSARAGTERRSGREYVVAP
jgi:hypothetical protein